jgi:hypothetical protein
MSSRNRTPLVSVKTRQKIERPIVAIDGRKFELAVPGDFTQFKQARALRLQMIVQGIQEKEPQDWTDDDLQQVEEATILLLSMMIPHLPRDVAERLGDDERNQLIAAFYENAEKVNAELEAGSDTSVSESPAFNQDDEEIIGEVVKAP